MNTKTKQLSKPANRASNAEDVLSKLLQTLSTAQTQEPRPEDVLAQVNSLAQQRIPAQGTMTGLIPAVVQAVRGQGFHPLAPQQQALGFDRAYKITDLARKSGGGGQSNELTMTALKELIKEQVHGTTPVGRSENMKAEEEIKRMTSAGSVVGTPEEQDYDPVTGKKTRTGIAGQKEIEVESALRKAAMEQFDKVETMLLPVIDQFDKQLSAIPVGDGPGGRANALMKEWLGASMQLDPFVATSVAQIKATRPLVSRSLTEVGNLSEYEQKTALGFVKNFSDTDSVRVLKDLGALGLVRKKLQLAIKRFEMEVDPRVTQRIQMLDGLIAARKRSAMSLGLDKEKLKKFLGDPDLYKQIENVVAPGEVRISRKDGKPYQRQEDGSWQLYTGKEKS